MPKSTTDRIKIVNTTKDDFSVILWFFEQAQKLQGKNGYRVWHHIDKAHLQNDIENNLQYKILKGNHILCFFSIQYSDPYIWRNRDNNDAIYLHRIVSHPDFRGEKQFEKVLNWAIRHARKNHRKFVRMDTW